MAEESRGGLPPVAEFAAWLADLKVRSGDPTLEQLSRLTGQVPRGHQVPKSTLGKALQGRSLPSLDVAVAVAQACALHAGWTGNAISATRQECADRWIRAKSSEQVAKISRNATEEPLADSDLAALQQHSEAEEEFLAKYYRCMTASLDRMELFGVTLRQQDFSYRMSTSYISLSAVRHGSTARYRPQTPAPTGYKDSHSGPLRVEDAIARSRRALIRGGCRVGQDDLVEVDRRRCHAQHAAGTHGDVERGCAILRPTAAFRQGTAHA
ncbi:hypothetical protein [Kitasatospora xanthocidica]|uniref:hypothetical protein n=1 Tax=Kitasatospora xanthocidica TaxID=83382 RepID=UPI001E58487F|nr:hypothetical protein [Kitasatospora xanthocidica]